MSLDAQRCLRLLQGPRQQNLRPRLRIDTHTAIATHHQGLGPACGALGLIDIQGSASWMPDMPAACCPQRKGPHLQYPLPRSRNDLFPKQAARPLLRVLR